MISTLATREGIPGEDPAAELSRLCGLAASLTGDPGAAREALRAAVKRVSSPGRSSKRDLRLQVAREALRLLPSVGEDPRIQALLPEFRADGSLACPGSSVPERAAPSPAQVREAIQSLPELHRRALLLRDAHRFELDEVASVLEMDASEVRRVVHSGRQALQGLLATAQRAF